MSIRKGSLVSLNAAMLTGFLATVADKAQGKLYKVESIVKGKRNTYAKIAGGITVPVIVLNYAGPQKKKGSPVRVKAQ